MRADTFNEAVDKLGERSVIGSQSRSADWKVPVALREWICFSATVESVLILRRDRTLIRDFLQGNREILPNG